MNTIHEKPVANFVADSDNAKIAPKKHKVSTTYVSIKASCPSTCELRDNGCYGQHGPIAIQLKKLDANAQFNTADEAATQEMEVIQASFKGKQIPQDGAKGGRDLRLHGFGDVTTIFGANQLCQAADDWKARNGGDVWTYTHSWKDIERKEFGPNLSILASLDHGEDAQAALDLGYAPAMVVPEHKSGKAYMAHGVRWVPCLAQTTDLKCTECRLCLNADDLHKRRIGIVFAAHGSLKNKIKRRLNVLA